VKKIFRFIILLPILIMGMLVSNTTPIAGSLRRLWNYAGDPTSGTSGTFAGMAQPGDLLIDETNGIVYKNTNTKASPTWIPLPAPEVTQKATGLIPLTIAQAGVIEATADAIYLYLPTYVDNAGLTYMIKCLATYSSGVKVFPYSASETIDGATSKISTAQYDCLTVVAGTNRWNITNKVGTWS
jgi:hypothetical protein